MKRLSVIIPMYNVEKHIEKCILSVYNQNLNEGDFEIILVDDESPDNSVNIAKKVTENFSNVSIISQKNKGLGGARNTGIENASGEYLLFLDSDDYYLKNTLTPILNISDKYNLDILEFGAQFVNEKEEVLFKSAKSNSPKVLTGIEYYNTFKYMNSACNKLYRKSFIKKNNLRFVEKIYSEDFEFNTRSLFYCSRSMAIDKIVPSFLQSEGSITRSKNLEQKRKYVNDLISIISRIKSFRKTEKENIKDIDSDLFFKERLSMVSTNVFFQMLKHNFPYKEAMDIKQKMIDQNLLYINHNLTDKKKNLFRKYSLKQNFFLYKILLRLNNLRS